MSLRPPLKSVINSDLEQRWIAGAAPSDFLVFRTAITRFYRYSPFISPAGMMFYGDDEDLRYDFLRATVLRDTGSASWIRFYDVKIRMKGTIGKNWKHIVDLPPYDSLDEFLEDFEDYRNHLWEQFVKKPAVNKPFDLFLVHDLPEDETTSFLELPVFREGRAGIMIQAPYADVFPDELLQSLDIGFYLGERNEETIKRIQPRRDIVGQSLRTLPVGLLSLKNEPEILQVLSRRQNFYRTQYSRDFQRAQEEDRQKFLDFLDSLSDGTEEE